MNKVTPERWQAIDDLLQMALERRPSERAAFLAAACAGDSELQQEVESLLGFHQQADGFLETPPAELAAELVEDKQTTPPAERRIGHYDLLRQIGRGGMGAVYLARDTRLGRQVALKLLHSHFTQDPERVRRFQQEARAASALNHPNIITIYEVGQVDQTHFIATEFVEGQTLRALMKGEELTLNTVLDIVLQTAGALAAAHEAGIIHRDIKPENLMVRPDGYVKVLDFGLAKLGERASGERSYTTQAPGDSFAAVETTPGIVMGTVSYMSPEQARGYEVDGRTDIFSLGVVLYELLARHEAFPGPTSYDILAALLHHDPVPLSQFNPQIPVELQQIVNRALAKEREARYQRIENLLDDLKALKQQLELDAQLKRSGRTTLVKEASRGEKMVSRRWLAAVGAILLIVLSFIAYHVWKVRQSPGATIQSIAVLPFKPLVAGQRDEVLEMGIADTLITQLSNLKHLIVLPISAVRRYTALDQDPISAGRQLEVQAVLEGNIQRSGDKIRITVRLINVADGKPLWTRQFDEPWTDIFAVQDAISQRVAGDLTVTLTGEDRNELARSYTSDPEAYELYMNGRYHWAKRTNAGMRKAVESFGQAIERDPRYALAYVGLADAYATLGSYHMALPREVLPLAQDAAGKALAIDPNLAEAHATMGKLFTDFNWNGERAEAEFRQAIALKPNYSNTPLWYSTLLAHLGRFDEAVREATRAMELDHHSPVATTQLGSVLYRARRYDQALEVLRKTLDLEPNYVAARAYLGMCHLAQRQYDEAQADFQKCHQTAPELADCTAMLGYANALAGRRDEALRYQQELNELAERNYVPPSIRAAIYAGLGDLDNYFKWAEESIEERDPSLRGLKTDPVFDRVRPDPRFATLLRRAGFEP